MKQKQTKLLFFLLAGIGGMALIQSCGADRNSPGRTYMPDMQYFRSYQAYADHNLDKEKANYLPYPVAGTIRRGDLFPYNLPDDSSGYAMSAGVKNPLPPLTEAQLKEAGRLYNVYCGICHGEKMDAQGPLSAGGKIPAVANLTLKQYVDMPEGTMFHAITYGKGYMGSYASQLTREQRWMVVEYVKQKQAGKAPEPEPTEEQEEENGREAGEPATPNTAPTANSEQTNN